MWHDLLGAFALVMVIEGVLPFLNPERFRQGLKIMLSFDDQSLRTMGLLSMIIGLVLLNLFG